MPTRLIPCKESGCSAVVAKGRYCPAHITDNAQKRKRKEFDLQRSSLSHRRIYSSLRWRALRLMFIRQHPFCQMESVCVQRTGHAAPSTDVHHVVGVQEDMSRAFDWDNLVAACHECHSQHTARTEGFAKKKEDEE